MAQHDYGNVHVELAAGVNLDPRAGSLDVHAVNQLEKARHDAATVGGATAQALKDHASAVQVPGLSADDLAKKATASQALGNTVANLETALRIMKQQQLIFDDDLHRSMRKVLAIVRADEKFDASLGDAFQALIGYFDNSEHHKKAAT